MKLHELAVDMLVFHCPGCKYGHAVTVNGRPFPSTGATWTWNGSMELPTFAPSLLIFANDPAQRCHSFVREGRIQFLDDCHHTLANQTIEIPDWDD